MKNLPTKPKEKSPKNLPSLGEFKREAFRFHFQELYKGIAEDDYTGIYKKLYSLYEKLSRLATIEPTPTAPEEFGRAITDEDLLNLESIIGVAYLIGFNFVASTLDVEAGRKPKPRDFFGDDSYPSD